MKRKIPDVLQNFGKRWSRRRSAGAVRPPRKPPPAPDPRAKSERHGKVAADRWNQ